MRHDESSIARLPPLDRSRLAAGIVAG